jgi:peroxiredoxin
MMAIRSVWYAIASLTLTLTVAYGSSGSEGVTVDAKVPDFSLKDLSGKEHSLYANLNQKGAVVMFISTQCPVSNAYNERMVELYKMYSGKGVAFLAVNSNTGESIEEIEKHSHKHEFEFPVLKDWRNVVADKFGALVTPETYLIDSTGVLRYHGRIDDSRRAAQVKERDLQNALDAYLQGKPIAKKEAQAMGCTIKRVN